MSRSKKPMDAAQAKIILAQALQHYQDLAYSELTRLIGSTFYENSQAGQVDWQLEILVTWDHKPGGAIRVIGMLGDGGWRSVFPYQDSLLRLPPAP